jgi:hypothetical protein
MDAPPYLDAMWADRVKQPAGEVHVALSSCLMVMESWSLGCDCCLRFNDNLSVETRITPRHFSELAPTLQSARTIITGDYRPFSA